MNANNELLKDESLLIEKSAMRTNAAIQKDALLSISPSQTQPTKPDAVRKPEVGLSAKSASAQTKEMRKVSNQKLPLPHSAVCTDAKIVDIDSMHETFWYAQLSAPGTYTGKWLILHTVTDQELRKELFDEIKQSGADFEPLTAEVNDDNAPTKLTVVWKVQRHFNFVVVRAILKGGGIIREISFRSEGSSPAEASKAAVNAAVSGVTAIVQRTMEESNCTE